MEKFELRQFIVKRAMYYGMWLALFLVIRFAIEVNADSHVWAFLSGFMLVMVPFVAYWIAYRFQKELKESDTVVSFGTILRFSIYIFFYASMILALVQFVFYRFIQPEFLASQLNVLTEALMQYQDVEPSIITLVEQMKSVGTPSASSVAIQTIWINIIIGLILGVPIAIALRDKKQK